MKKKLLFAGLSCLLIVSGVYYFRLHGGAMPGLDDFLGTVQGFIDDSYGRERYGNAKELWVDGKVPSSKEFFVQHLEVPSNARVFFFTDIHGFPEALEDFIASARRTKILDGYKIIKTRNYFVFLGDYADRGLDGDKVFDIVLKLKRESGKNVVLLRGNHDREKSAERGDFGKELRGKYGLSQKNKRKEVYKLFEYLPVACFLTWKNKDIKRGILCAHGGFALPEVYEPKKLFAQKKVFEVLPGRYSDDPRGRDNPGGGIREFIWGDFEEDPDKETWYDDRRGALKRSEDDAEAYLEDLFFSTKVTFLGMIRGHQHSDSMKWKLRDGFGTYFFWRDEQWDGDEESALFLKELSQHDSFVLTLAPFNYSSIFPLPGEATWTILKLREEFEKCRFDLLAYKES